MQTFCIQYFHQRILFHKYRMCSNFINTEIYCRRDIKNLWRVNNMLWEQPECDGLWSCHDCSL